MDSPNHSTVLLVNRNLRGITSLVEDDICIQGGLTYVSDEFMGRWKSENDRPTLYRAFTETASYVTRYFL